MTNFHKKGIMKIMDLKCHFSSKCVVHNEEAEEDEDEDGRRMRRRGG